MWQMNQRSIFKHVQNRLSFTISATPKALKGNIFKYQVCKYTSFSTNYINYTWAEEGEGRIMQFIVCMFT